MCNFWLILNKQSWQHWHLLFSENSFAIITYRVCSTFLMHYSTLGNYLLSLLVAFSRTLNTVWKLLKFTFTLFSQKFRESNCFINSGGSGSDFFGFGLSQGPVFQVRVHRVCYSEPLSGSGLIGSGFRVYRV